MLSYSRIGVLLVVEIGAHAETGRGLEMDGGIGGLGVRHAEDPATAGSRALEAAD